MGKLGFVFTEIVCTLLRFVPMPWRVGLVRIGDPGSHSPVFVTGNYRLTVARVLRALRGVDAYLVVANSRGVNVWCAATGGLFTTHDVVSALKTTGIENLVSHREVILPQLAATGIEAREVEARTGWTVVWGPVSAFKIKEFLAADKRKDTSMRVVRFPWPDRVEMAVAWAFPISVIGAALCGFFWPQVVPILVLASWTLPLVLFLAFPAYESWLNPPTDGRRLKSARFTRWVPVVLAFAFVLALGQLWLELSGWSPEGFLWKWAIVSALLALLVTTDLSGSTPVYKSSFHGDGEFRVALRPDRCRGAALCWEVCPRDCFEMDWQQRKVTVPRAHLCVQCGACVVQCPHDALVLRAPDGRIIPPDVLRRYKLNLLGKRAVPVNNRT